jgi:hypothetical protein
MNDNRNGHAKMPLSVAMSSAAALFVGCLLAAPAAEPGRYFQITVVDRHAGRGVPLVELSTVNGIRYVTDSNGIVAFDEPGLMGQKVFFFVKSHGYEFPADAWFGYRGRSLEVEAGGKARLEIDRKNIAERLYRVTGEGIYRDSVLTGAATPIDKPLLNAKVLGSDSVLTAVFGGRMHWFWGDTNRPSHPLGNFQTTGATSALPGQGGLDPAAGVELAYFENDEGFARPMAPMPGDGPTWLDGLVVLREGERERMFAAYAKVRPPLTIYARGLAEFNPQKEVFEQAAEFDLRSPIFPSGHPVVYEHADKKKYVYFADPFPLVRVPAEADALADLSRYEAFTCLEPGSRLDVEALGKAQLDRRADGRLNWAWKRNTSAINPQAEAKLVQAGRIEPDEALVQLREPDTGEIVVAHRGSVYFNAYRRRWVLVAVQSEGSSPLGEIWYAEADTLVGPWVYARKIATHDRYSFYNPKQHPQFAQDAGRFIFFEGTYTNTFSGNPEATPRYDYNQIMYRLDLADERSCLPEPVYERLQADGARRFGVRRPALLKTDLGAELAFFAVDRPREGLAAIYEIEEPSGGYRLSADPPAGENGAKPEPLFYALPIDKPPAEERPAQPKRPPVATQPLREFVPEAGGQRLYTIAAEPPKGYRRTTRPICRVWAGR